MKNTRTAIFALMRALNQINSHYDESAKQYDIKEPELWLMYGLSEGEPFSQKQFCEEWMVSRTTLNTIVKDWEKKGYLSLTPIPGKRREMTISLTPAGKEWTQTYLQKLFRMETEAMEATIAQYSESFIEVVQFFEQQLKENLKKEFFDSN